MGGPAMRPVDLSAARYANAVVNSSDLANMERLGRTPSLADPEPAKHLVELHDIALLIYMATFIKAALDVNLNKK